MGSAAVVGAVNGLAARWARAAVRSGGGTVFAPVGVWPLLGALAAGADGVARAELAEAVGLPAAEAMAGVHRLMGSLGRLPGVSAALGVWAREGIALEPAWAAELPDHTLGVLSGDAAVDRGRLDAWAARSTAGLIPEMPVQLDEDSRLVLASAMTVRTRWIRPFWESIHTPSGGPWAGRCLPVLCRTTGQLGPAAVLHTPYGPVTELAVLGYDGIEIRLLLGAEGAEPAAVLEAGMDALGGRAGRVTADVLTAAEAGPGMEITRVPSRSTDPRLAVTTVPFAIATEHDMLAEHALFGLTAASDTAAGHFSGICRSEPLAVGSARQNATAGFSAEGFEAATVTAVGLAVGGAWTPPPFRARRVDVTFDRPFGFLAVHRFSRLVLAAGWVDEAPEAAFGIGH